MAHVVRLTMETEEDIVALDCSWDDAVDQGTVELDELLAALEHLGLKSATRTTCYIDAGATPVVVRRSNGVPTVWRLS